MCGICGSLSFARDPVDPASLRPMLAAMVHRGPDAGGTFAEPGIAAGIRRLAVIDVDGGDQPIANEDGTVQVVFNGEIYNFQELRDRLAGRGHRFRTRSDTEVLVHLWEDDGPEMVHRLNGMFAFCIHDRRSGETFIARDRLGIKPLYYRSQADGLVFASEVGVLRQHDGTEEPIEPSALVELYCLQYVSGDRTIYRRIRKLLPGHAIHVRNGRPRFYRYYEPARFDTPAGDEIDARGEELRELLTTSVRYRKIADVPLGVFLSGGLDSSVIFYLLSGMVDHPVRTFSLGFDADDAFDERRFARIAAECFGAEHHELRISAMDIAKLLPRLIEHLAEPVMDPALIPTYLLAEFARQQVTVVLTGEGADELFGGYRRYLYQKRYGWLGKVPGLKLVGRGALQGRLPRRVDQALGAVGEKNPVENYLQWSATVGRSVATELFAPDLYAAFEQRVVENYAGYFSDQVRLEDQLRVDQHEWLPHNLLAKVDRASMAFSLEARVPFLDHRIVEWAASLPEDFKIRGSRTKYILRESFKAQLPKEILERPKQGFDLPLAAWIRGPLRPLVAESLESSKLERWPGLNGPAVIEMLRAHQNERQDFGLPLFGVLSIMLFLERFG
jgi:asparagine synthase (glutamine-hydrolysing)